MNFEEKREALVGVLKELAKREFPYNVAVDVLRKNGLMGNGYPRFIAKIQSLEESEINNTNVTQALIELHELLDNFIKFGNKRITIFRLDPKDLKLVKENLDTFTQSLTYSEDDFSIPDGISVNREYCFKTLVETDDALYYYFNIDRNYYERKVVTDEAQMDEISGVLHLQQRDEIFKVITYKLP